MLVVKASPKPEESLMGYVLRLTELNGYPTTSYLLHAMTGKWFASTVGRLDATPLILLADLTEGEARRLSMEVITQSRSVYNLAGCELTAHDLSVSHAKVCPSCLRESGHCDAFWDIGYAVACPRHGTRLVGSCPDCGDALTWRRGKVSECRCGYDLASVPAPRAAAPVIDLMGAMRAALYRDDAIAPWPASMTHLQALNLGQLCKLVWVMCDVLHRSANGGGLIRSRAKLAPYLEEVAEALSNWPLGFRAFLDRHYAARLEAADCLPAFRTEFSWVLTRLAKNTDAGEAFGFLAQEIFTFAARYWTRTHLSSRGGMFKDVILPETMRWGSAGECAEVLGLHMTTMKRDAEALQFPHRIAVSPNSRRGKTYDLDWARAQAPKSRSRPLGVRQAARILGISNGVVEILRQRGVFERSNRLTHRNGVFTREEIDQFQQKLRSAIGEAQPSERKGLPTIDRLSRKSHFSTETKANLYEAILERKIVVRGNAGGAPEQYQVDPDQVYAVLKEARDAQDQYVTFSEASALLQCTSTVLKGLVDAKFLHRSTFRGRRRLLKSSVKDFDDTYVLISQISRLAKQWSRAVAVQVRNAGVPMREVICHQHTAFFVERRHLHRVLKAINA